MFLLAIGGAKTVLSICRAETLNCGSNFTNCQDYDGVIRILKMSLCLILNTIKEYKKSLTEIFIYFSHPEFPETTLTVRPHQNTNYRTN